MDWKNINFQHLNYFLIAAKYQNFGQAADELFINYSTLSKAIAGLEAQLNVKLFEKDGRNLKLTKYGKILYGYVYSAMSDIRDGIDEIAQMTDPEHGIVKISSVFTASAKYLPDKISKFQQAYPELKVEISQTYTEQIINRILDGKIDIGFCGEFDYAAHSDEITREFIYNDEIVLIVPSSHRLANRRTVSFDDIKEEAFIGYNSSAGMNYSIRTALKRIAGPEFKLNTSYEMNEETGVVGMVRANLGIAFVSTRAELDYDDIKVLKLSDLYIAYNIYMIWQKNEYLPGSINSFKNFILSQLVKK